MTKTKRDSKTEKSKLIKKLKVVDTLFVDLEKDKTLPTFVEHFALCIILGSSEKVNLKTMYPKVHNKLNRLIQSHSEN
jgi:hypothetical protein